MVDAPARVQIEYVVAEYAATQEAYLHYDAFRWQAGSLLVAGAFVFLGFLASSTRTDERLSAAASIVVAAVMTIWILFNHHHRQLYLFKIDRLIELEMIMGAEQHRRFNRHGGTAKYYRARGPAGHNLDLAVYLLAALAAPALAVTQREASWWQLLAVAIVAGGFATVRRNEKLTLQWLAAHRSPPP